MTAIYHNTIKFGALLFAVGLVFIFSPHQAHAGAWLNVDAHFPGNAYQNGYWSSSGPDKIPASLGILLHSDGNFDGGTTFYVDCDNDGTYEQTIGGQYNNGFYLNNSQRAIEWSNGYSLDRHSWMTPGQWPWGYEEPQFWYDAQTSCSFTTPGIHTIGLKATRGGLTALGGLTSKPLLAREFTFQLEWPSNGDYKPPINDQNAGYINPGTSAPANIDLLIGMREQDVRYQSDYYAGYDSRYFGYTVDCDEDGQFDDYSGSSNNGANGNRAFPGYPPIWTGGTFADNICRITVPGRHMINLKIIDPVGQPHVVSKEVFVISSEPFKISVYPVGQNEGDAKYYFQEPQSVGISFKITGLTPINTGSYNTTINCGNGQPTISGPGANGRNYPDGTLIAENAGTCSYSIGTYTVKVSFQENKPASEALQPKSGDGTTTIVVLGNVSVCTYADVVGSTYYEQTWSKDIPKDSPAHWIQAYLSWQHKATGKYTFEFLKSVGLIPADLKDNPKTNDAENAIKAAYARLASDPVLANQVLGSIGLATPEQQEAFKHVTTTPGSSGVISPIPKPNCSGVSTVVWPFELKWQVNDATSCSIVGGAGTNFSAAGLGTSGTKPVSKVTVRTDPYEYKLTCTGANGSSDRTIKVKVVDVLE